MPLYVAGAGGLGREVLDAALAAGLTVDAFLDDRLCGTQVRGLDVLRLEDVREGGHYVVGIADPAVRLRITERAAAQGLLPRTVIHPRALLGPETAHGVGCVVLAGAHVSSSVQIGDHVHVHYNATVGHDASLEDRASVYPGANVGGAVRLGADVTIGSNATVLQGLRVGAGSTVGAGAVVTKDVAAGTVVVGAPARPLKGSTAARPAPGAQG